MLTSLVLLTGCADVGGTLVAFTLHENLRFQDEGEHLAMFATINGGAAGLLQFEVVPGDSQCPQRVIDHRDPTRVLGCVDGVDGLILLPIAGVRFRTPVVLADAVELFVTREPNGDTDPSPNGELVLECTLSDPGDGTRRCDLITPKGDKQGTATLVVGADGVNPL